MNKVILIGNLVNDPEYLTSQSGVSITKFRLAMQRKFANSNGVREADFVNCVAFKQTADFINNYFRKGMKIAIEGNLHSGSYNAQDGSKRYTLDVYIDNAEFVSSKNDDGGSASGSARNKAQHTNSTLTGEPDMSKFTEVEDDELPF